MIGFSVIDDSALIYLDEVSPALRERMGREIVSVGEILYAKVMENVSGKILQTKTGQLAGSIVMETDVASDPMSVFVGPVPETPKAFALEFGGKGSYEILPTKSRLLHFFSKSGDEVFTSHVNHPPSKAFRYLREALDELRPTIEGTFLEAVEEGLSRE